VLELSSDQYELIPSEERGGEIMPSLMATPLHWRTHSARTNIFKHIQAISKPKQTYPNRSEPIQTHPKPIKTYTNLS
jgi:hypothetical protein